MVRKRMEGSEEQKRRKAREARERGSTPSAEGVTTGASKQRRDVQAKDHREKLDDIRRGKQDVIGENTPEPRPGYGHDEDEESRGRS